MTDLKNIEYPLRLCVEMLSYAGHGAYGKTEHMTYLEIKDALRRFFTEEQINKAQAILTGKVND